MPRTRLVGRVDKLIRHTLNERPSCLFHAHAPESVGYVLPVTDEGDVVLRDVLPVGTHLPSFAFAGHRPLLTAQMISLCVRLLGRVRSAGVREEDVLEGISDVGIRVRKVYAE